MGRFLNPDSGLMRGLSYVGDMMLLNILFLLCSLPVATLGASTAALYEVAGKMAEHEESGIVKPFFRAFAKNLKKATLTWMILFLLGAVWYFGEGVLSANPGAFPVFIKAAYLMVLLCLLLTGAWVFAIEARYENTVGQHLKNAFLLAVAHPGKSVLILILTYGIPALFLFATYWFLLLSLIWFLFGFSGGAILISILMKPVFRRLETGQRDSA